MPGIKRYKIPFIGALKETLSQTVFWMSIINFLLIGLTAYNTTLKTYIIDLLPWVQAWMFILVMVCILAIAMLIEYKFIMPAYYEFRGGQYKKHSEWNGSSTGTETKEEVKDFSREELKKILNEVLDERDRNNNSSKTSNKV